MMVVYVVLVELRGMVFGVFNLVSGIVMFVLSVVVGFLWDWVGVVVMFYVGVVFSVVIIVLFVCVCMLFGMVQDCQLYDVVVYVLMIGVVWKIKCECCVFVVVCDFYFVVMQFYD